MYAESRFTWVIELGTSTFAVRTEACNAVFVVKAFFAHGKAHAQRIVLARDALEIFGK